MSEINQPFYTQPKPLTNQQYNLRNYVNNLDKKIDYAKWKQNLVLKYNYIPLKTISDKIEIERQAYQKILKEEQEKCRKVLTRKDFTEQLVIFKQFSTKLKNKIKDIQFLIDQENLKKKMLQEQVKDIKANLQTINKQNRWNEVQKLQSQLTIKTDTARLKKSKTFQYIPNLQYRSIQNNTSSQSTPFDNISYHILFNDCLNKVISQIRTLNSSQDVQCGIYLDVMKTKNEEPKPKYSIKSHICDTLMDRFSKKAKTKTQGVNNSNDFDISWENFKKLNWKQIMGVVLVKDRQCKKLKKILK